MAKSEYIRTFWVTHAQSIQPFRYEKPFSGSM